jgi:hypothetical protein
MDRTGPSRSRDQPETLIGHGDPAAEIFKVIEADEDMAMLVLAVGSSQKGPGPLVAELGRTGGPIQFQSLSYRRTSARRELDALS